MVIERPLELGQPRRLAWCLYSELTDNGDGTYNFIDTELNNSMGFGSEVHVIDKDLKLLFDSNNNILYEQN